MENLLQHLWSRKPAPDSFPITLKTFKERISYEKLERQSCAFAALLKEAGCAEGNRLCFMTRKKETAIMVMVGIMKAGCVGIPVDPQSTSEKIHSAMVNSDSNWLFTDESASSYPDPLLIDTGEISLGWLGDSGKVPKSISPEFISENISQYAEDPCLEVPEREPADFTFILSDEKGQMEQGHLATSRIETFINQLNAVSDSLKSGRVATLFPDSGYRLFAELFGTANRRGYFYLLSDKLLEDLHGLLSLLNDQKISRLFVSAEEATKLTKGLEKVTTVCDGIREIVIWGKRPPQKNLSTLKAFFPKCEIINRLGGRVQNEQKHDKRENEPVISKVVFPHKSLEHWEKLFFGLTEDSMFSRLRHTDYIRDIKTGYLNYWRKVEEKNMLTIHQPVKLSFNNDI